MEKEKIVYLNSKEDLEEFSKQGKHILYFSSKNCNVCHSVFPKLVEITAGYDMQIGRIDVNENKELAGQHLVFALPTIIMFNESSEVLRESRFIEFQKIDRMLEIIFS